MAKSQPSPPKRRCLRTRAGSQRAAPTIISMTPTTCMNAAGPMGSSRAAKGLTYPGQFVSRIVNLSAPATMGTIPRAMRSAQ